MMCLFATEGSGGNVSRFKNAMEKLWTGECDITAFETVTDDDGITKNVKVLKGENIPCRISYKTYKRDRAGEQSGTVDKLSREVRLILGKDAEISAGCRVVVRQNGEERSFVAAGIPAVYSQHKEVMISDEEIYG